MSFEMPEQEQHTMEFVGTHKSGVDELYCPICGRRILLQWPPNYKKTVLEPGNEHAIHSGGKGGLTFKQPEIAQDDNQEAEDEIYLAPWNDWMNKVDFNGLWD